MAGAGATCTGRFGAIVKPMWRIAGQTLSADRWSKSRWWVSGMGSMGRRELEEKTRPGELFAAPASLLPADWLEQFRAVYPRRTGGQGWGAVPRLVQKILASGGTWPLVLAGATSYRNHCMREGLIGTAFVMQARTFVGPDLWWQESYEPEAKPKLPAEIQRERRWQDLKDRAGYAGFRQPSALELSCDPSVFEGQLINYERNQGANSNVTQLYRDGNKLQVGKGPGRS